MTHFQDVDACPELLAGADAARILNLTPQGVRECVVRGALKPAAKTPGGQRLFRREDVERFAREREQRKAAASV